MPELDLDVLPGALPLGAYAQRMSERRQGAVAVDVDGRLHLLTADRLTELMNEAGRGAVFTDAVRRSGSRIPQIETGVPRPNHIGPGVESHAIRPLPGAPEAPGQLRVVGRFDRAAGPLVRVTGASLGFMETLNTSVTFYRCEGPEPDIHVYTRATKPPSGYCKYPHAQPTRVIEIDD